MTRPFYTLDHYGRRLDRVLEYIDANLTIPLRLSILAAHASFSPSHFHQIFREWQGETPQNYVRRCRLERGAALLHYGQGTAVKDIAPQCGFTSVEAFDRAFHSYFGMTPTEWRGGGFAHWNPPAESPTEPSLNLSSNQVEIQSLSGVQVLYKRKLGPYKTGEIELWNQLSKITGALALRDQTCFGVGLDDPAVTPLARCRFDACIALPASVSIPINTPTKLIPGGPHAVLSYTGPLGNTEAYWTWLFQTWLPENGYKVSQHACFERYRNGIPLPGQVVHSELCLPLVR